MYRSVRRNLSTSTTPTLRGALTTVGVDSDELLFDEAMSRSDSAASSVNDIKLDIDNRRIAKLSEISRKESLSSLSDVLIQEKLCAINDLQNGE